MKKFPQFFPWTRRLYQFVNESLTHGGRSLLLGLLLSSSSLVAFDPLLSRFFWMFLASAISAGFASHLFRPRLEIRVRAPSLMMAGETAKVRIAITNRSRFPSFDLGFDLPDAPDSWNVDRTSKPLTILHGRSWTAEIGIQPNCRGVFDWSKIRATTTFPLGLFQRHEVALIPGRLIVLPRYPSIAGDALTQRCEDASGDWHTVQTGESFEFLGNREYRPGIPVRRWDHRAWARLGQPIVREFCEDGDRCIGIIVDASYTEQFPTERTSAEFEALVSLAVSIAETVSGSDSRIEWLISGAMMVHSCDAGGARREIAILEALAGVQLDVNGKVGDGARVVEQLSEFPDEIFMLLRRWDAESADAFAQLCQVANSKAIVVSSRPLSNDLSDAATVTISVADINAGYVEIP